MAELKPPPQGLNVQPPDCGANLLWDNLLWETLVWDNWVRVSTHVSTYLYNYFESIHTLTTCLAASVLDDMPVISANSQ
jgi:hypothetical protein